jgi:hypothetical protein
VTWRKVQTSRSEDYCLPVAGSSPMPWCDTIVSIYSSHAGALLGRIETDVCEGGYAKARAFDQGGLHWLNVKTIQIPMRFGASGTSQVMNQEASAAGIRSGSPLRISTNGRQEVRAQGASMVGGSNRRSASPPTVGGRDGGLPSSSAQGPMMAAEGTLMKQQQRKNGGSGAASQGVDATLGRSGVSARSAGHLVMFKTVASFGEFSLSKAKRSGTACDDYELHVTEQGTVTNRISTLKTFNRCDTSHKNMASGSGSDNDGDSDSENDNTIHAMTVAWRNRSVPNIA